MVSQTDQFKAAKQEMQRAFEKAEKEENWKIKETNKAKEPSPWLRREAEKETNMPFDSWMDIMMIKQYVKGWKGEQEKNAAGEDCDEDKGFDDGEDDEGVEGVKGAAEEVNEGFEDEMSKETKWMQ
ncbi:hypothetical protein VF21_10323 [Pseudogymnoascus sp. 05NY08]|nr:hypothetical protein VF21_10323 [Pseudogymnoascus sp. 05NY08]